MTSNKNILVSQKFNNYNYAPGIATYGIDGKTGETGADGNNIYFTDFDFKNIEELKLFASQLVQNYLPLKNSTIKIARSYKNDDLFFNQLGIIYRLNHIDELLNNIESITGWEAYFNIAGRLTIANDSSLFTLLDNRLILNSSLYGGYDIVVGPNPTDVSNLINKNSAVNIISNKVNENNNIEMINIQSIDDVDIEDGKLSVYYKTTENAFYLDSNKPIVIDGDVKLNNDNNTNNEYDNFSTVLTSNDTITYFKHICDGLRYNVLYDSDVNRYKLIIYQEDSGSDKLEYLINRNETVYGKVYDGENNQILLKLSNIINAPTSSSNYYDYQTKYNDISIGNIEYNNFNFILYDKTIGTPSELQNIPVMVTTQTNFNIQTYKDINKITIDINSKIPIIHNQYNQSNGVIVHEFDVNPLFNSRLFEIAIIQPNKRKNIFKITGDYNQVSTDDGPSKNTFLCKQFSENNIYKFTFNSADFKIPDASKRYVLINIYPLLDISNNIYTNAPISLSLQLFRNTTLIEDTEYTLYFTLDYSEEKFSIKNIMLFDRDNLDKQPSTEEKPCIVSYLPDSIESVYRFSLLHNTEVFINYQE